MESVTYPYIAVPNDLLATGGSGRLLWPAMEGVLIEDVDKREDNAGMRYRPMRYPNRGWEGFYPGPCQTQFFAYYADEGGLYLGAHDAESAVKSLEFFKDIGGIRLEIKTYSTDHEMVLGVFEGDWHDAAEIYRKWYDTIKSPGLKKIADNEKLPAWIAESPVVMVYPVRGTRDLGDMTPNEYFPYVNMLPYMKMYSQRFQSKVMALMMHWEGTAPWAPPYVWPPFGGEEGFLDFVGKAHESGNLVGVYCSGMGWTNESNTDPSYVMREKFEKENLASVMCAAPDGSTPNSKICNGPHGQRYGHDMCPGNESVKDIVVDEVRKVVDSGVDYAQYFDQNLGGAAYLCYADNHGHPPAPGKWQAAEMRKLLSRVDGLLAERGRKALIGCEAAAAEPFMEYLYFNDLRSSVNLSIGRPVPVYSYLFHEYTCNFMGNQNGLIFAIDFLKMPDNLLFRLSYAFISGDLLTIVLKGKGAIHWDWGTEWDVEEPDQESTIRLIRHLNAWRTGAAKEFLFGGKMLKPYETGNESRFELIKSERAAGGNVIYPGLLCSKWRSVSGRTAQIMVNVTREVQKFELDVSNDRVRSYRIVTDPDKTTTKIKQVESGKITGEVQPLSAMLVELFLTDRANK